MGTTYNRPRAAAGISPFTPDPTVEQAQREFTAADAEPAWALKPRERVCTSCWLVQPCDCEAY